MITVALPTWNNRKIIWLALEGLCRQKTDVEWELIVMECFSPNIVGEGWIREHYGRRLADAGCQKIKYLFNHNRLPLSAKWREMGKLARGVYFTLQGSDDYPHPERLQQTWDAGADWFDIRRYYHYDVKSGKMVLFDSLVRENGGEQYNMTGECMAIRTKLLRNMPATDVGSSVDHFLLNNCGVKNRYIHDGIYAGIATTGMNTISITRDYYFKNVVPPFYETDQTIDTIGMPEDVTERLKTLWI